MEFLGVTPRGVKLDPFGEAPFVLTVPEKLWAMTARCIAVGL
jgi:hypothetical protein